MSDVSVVKSDEHGEIDIIEYLGAKFKRVRPTTLNVNMQSRPNLLKNKSEALPQIAGLLDVMDRSYKEDWAKKLHDFTPDMDYWTLVMGIASALMDFRSINYEMSLFLSEGDGEDGWHVHPMQMLREGKWHEHFDEVKGKVDEQAIAKVFAKYLNYMNLISMQDLYDALNCKKPMVYKDYEIPAIRSLRWYPAIKYQETLKGFKQGRLIDGTGWFDGGMWAEETTCPACKTTELKDDTDLMVCPHCLLGLKKETTANETNVPEADSIEQ